MNSSDTKRRPAVEKSSPPGNGPNPAPTTPTDPKATPALPATKPAANPAR
jgi:hypothetical protein